MAGLKRSMDEFGDLSGIVFNRRTKQLVGGHQRQKNLDRKAMVTIVERFKPALENGTVAVGFVETPTGERWSYREVDWDERRQRAANVAANNPALQGDFEFTLLADILADLEGNSYDATLTGFDERAVENILSWAPKDLDQITAEMGEFEPEDVWPEIRVRVPPDVKKRYDEIMAGVDGATEADKFAAILDRA